VLTSLVVAACAALFIARSWRPPVTRAMKLQEASALVNAERVDEAIEALDALDTRALDGEALRDWLGLKGYALALAGCGEEALDCIDDLASLADPDDRQSQLMVNGTRAIVAIADDKVDDAATLLDATERFAAATGALAASNLAEVWWWRAALAERRGDAADRRACLEKAAGFGDVHYADRARAALHDVAAR
jgi:hypothetical protein